MRKGSKTLTPQRQKILTGIRDGLRPIEIATKYNLGPGIVTGSLHYMKKQGIVRATGSVGGYEVVESTMTNGQGRGIVRQAMQQVSVDAKIGKAILDLELLSKCEDHPEKLVAWINITRELMR